MNQKSKKTEATVKVSLGSRSYDVKIGHGVIDRLGHFMKAHPSKRAFVISDERLSDPREKVLATLKRAGWEIHEWPVKAGESLKDMQNLYSVYGAMLKARMDRHSTLIALGGGSVGDAAGFVASTYMRGLRWVGLPTTLLGQVDSSIGGKTAVNHPEGKNLIGTFYQPRLVVCETGFLKTLSQREILSGMGEVVKYGLTFDKKLFTRICEHWQEVLNLNEEILTEFIQTSVKWKARAVVKDEFDETGVREVLNFGHTFAHALEKVSHYNQFQHGEAVLWGMRFAAALSYLRRKIKKTTWSEIDGFLKELPLPPLPSDVPFESYLSAMSKDKKVSEGKVRFVLLKGLGQSILDRNVTDQNLRDAFQIIGGGYG
jgi:3-dehydroquinate synthase